MKSAARLTPVPAFWAPMLPRKLRGQLTASKVLLVILLSWARAVGSEEIFVSTDGQDVDADGTEERPFLRIQTAIDHAWDYDVIILTPGRHVSDREIRFRRKKLTLRPQHAPITRTGGCWPIHTADPTLPTLTRCNVTSWPQSFSVPTAGEDRPWDTPATSGQTLPASFVDAGLDDDAFHGSTLLPIPTRFDPPLCMSRPVLPTPMAQAPEPRARDSAPRARSEGGDYADPGDAPRGNPDDLTCGGLGCVLGFHGAGSLQAGVISNTTLVGARLVFAEGDEVVLRDLDIRGDPEARPAAVGGCLYANGRSLVTVVDSVFSFCRATAGGGAAALGFGARVVFSGARFLNNTGGQRGGAVLLQGEEGAARFTACEFSGNGAQGGGAVYTGEDAAPVLEQCDFFANRAARGGALLAAGRSAVAVLDSALLHHAGAEEGGAVLAREDARVLLAGCSLHNNSARARGGAVHLEGRARATLEACALHYNAAPRGGGAIFAVAPARAALASCALGGNSAQRGAREVEPAALVEFLNGTMDGSANASSSRPAASWFPSARPSGNLSALPQGVFGARSGLVNGQCSRLPLVVPPVQTLPTLPCFACVCLDLVCSHCIRCRPPAGSVIVCGGHGRVSPEQPLLCDCDLPWVGAASECNVRCLGYNESSGDLCSGHGECDARSAHLDRECRWFGGRRWMCSDTGVAPCRCDFGYLGAACEQQCPGTSAPAGSGREASAGVCSGHGQCVLYNGTAACSCEFGWGGPACDELRLYVLALGGAADGARVVRLGDRVLVNNRQRGLHLLALNRSDLTVAWDRAYDVGFFADGEGTFEPGFFPGGDNDGTLAGNASAAGGGGVPDARHPHRGELLFREDEANRMARDLSLLDGTHLVVVTSLYSWENQTNAALVQALARCGAPDLAPYAAEAQGRGHALALVGEPDAGGGNGSFLLAAPPGAASGNRSRAELELNLRRGTEAAAPLWCGARVYEGGVDASHLKGTRCVPRGARAANFVDGFDGVVGGGSPDNARTFEPAEDPGAEDALAAGNSSNDTNSSEATVVRWRVVPRTVAGGHHPGGVSLETWDLATDFDATEGDALVPLLQSDDTRLQQCCNRSRHWLHGGCRAGHSVAPDPERPERLVCLETGFRGAPGDAFDGAGDAGAPVLWGNLDLAGPAFAGGARLRAHAPRAEAPPLAARYGEPAPYAAFVGHRNRPFTAADRAAPAGRALAGRAQHPPTVVFKECSAGRLECGGDVGGPAAEGAGGRGTDGLAVDGECARGQCGGEADTGWEEQLRWERGAP